MQANKGLWVRIFPLACFVGMPNTGRLGPSVPRNMIKTSFFWRALLFVFLAAVPGFTQYQNGILRGVILDQQGGAVPNANVTATNENTNVSVTTKTSTTGVYTFPDLLVGSYTLKAEASGFRGYTRTGIQVLAAQVTDVTANLELGGLTTDVVVESAGSNIVQTESSQLSGTFQARAASEIPVITGANLSVQNLAIFLPNTTTQLGGVAARHPPADHVGQEHAQDHEGARARRGREASPRAAPDRGDAAVRRPDAGAHGRHRTRRGVVPQPRAAAAAGRAARRAARPDR